MEKTWTIGESVTKSDGSALTQEEKDKIDAEVNRISEELGLQPGPLSESDQRRLTQALVQAARPKDSPLHCIFEWAWEIAAQKYRANKLKEREPRGRDK